MRDVRNKTANTLSPLLVGAMFIVLGAFLTLIGLGVIPVKPAKWVPLWMVACFGAMFASAGATLMFGASDGTSSNAPPIAVRVARLLSGVAVPALMSTMFAWISLGPGPRPFRTRINLPLGQRGLGSSEFEGRVAFGVCACILALIAAATLLAGIRRLIRPRRWA